MIATRVSSGEEISELGLRIPVSQSFPFIGVRIGDMEIS